MLEIDGPGLWRVLKEQCPELIERTAFITGDTLSATIAPFLKEDGAPLLEKTFIQEQVTRACCPDGVKLTSKPVSSNQLFVSALLQ